MSVLFPPYSGGGGGGGVASVNGDTGPAVVLDAADVGAVGLDQMAITSTANRLYGTGNTGQPTVYIISSGTTTGSVAQRGPSGVLAVGDPTAATHAVSRQYLETVLAGYVQSDGSVTDLVSKTEAEMAGITPDATTVYAVTP